MINAHDSQPWMDAIEWFQGEFEKRFRILGPLTPVVYQKLFGWAETVYHQFLRSEEPIFPTALRIMGLDYLCSPEELLRIPRAGPGILVANHPYGGFEVLLLGAILNGIRLDYRFLATSTAMIVPPVREFVIPLVRHRDRRPADANLASLRAAVRWLRSGGLIVVFPSGVSASRPAPTFKLTEQPWTNIAAVLAQQSGATVVPVFFQGRHHWMFYAASLLHPDLRYMYWILQALRQKRRMVRISIGTPIQPQRLIEQWGLTKVTDHLRVRTLELNEP